MTNSPAQVNIFDFQKDRSVTKKKLTGVYLNVKTLFDENKELCELKNQNKLIREYWRRFEDAPVDSITRTARMLRVFSEYDTNENQKIRGNRETAIRQFICYR